MQTKLLQKGRDSMLSGEIDMHGFESPGQLVAEEYNNCFFVTKSQMWNPI